MNLGKIVGTGILIGSTIGFGHTILRDVAYSRKNDELRSEPKIQHLVEVGGAINYLEERTESLSAYEDILSVTYQNEILSPVREEFDRLNKKHIELIRDDEMDELQRRIINNGILREKNDKRVKYFVVGMIGGMLFRLYSIGKVKMPVDDFSEEFEKET